MRLDPLKLCVVLLAMTTGSLWAANTTQQGGGTAPKPAPKPAPPPAQKPAPAPAPKPAPAPAAKPAPAPAPKPVVIVKTVPAPRPAPRPPVRPNNQPQNQIRQVTVNTDYTVSFADKGEVRLLDEPFEFDEKGSRKRLAGDDLKKAKGETPEEQKMEGFKADFSDLKVGDSVKVYLGTFKLDPKKKTTTLKKESEGEKTEKKETEEAKKDDAKKDDDKKDDKKADAADDDTEKGRWLNNTVLEGKVTKIDKPNGSTPKFTIRVVTTEQKNVQVRPNQPGQPNNNNNNNNNNNPTTENRTVNIGPEQKQASKVVVARREAKPAPADKVVAKEE